MIENYDKNIYIQITLLEEENDAGSRIELIIKNGKQYFVARGWGEGGQPLEKWCYTLLDALAEFRTYKVKTQI